MAEYKDISDLKKQIADFKKAVYSPNSDYLTGYVCALSATEGIIAGIPTAYVVEVVHCKDCKWRNTPGCVYKCTGAVEREDYDFCSDGERKS